MPSPQAARTRPWRTLAAALALSLATAVLVPGPTAVAVTTPDSAATVAADALPTVQVDGVVWAQAVVGSRVYVTGDFDFARPAGAAAGTDQTARSNLLAYDLRTGALVTAWAPTLNAQGLAITASPDGTRVYVGGDFTQANGVARNRVVALDAQTGALVPGFAPAVNGRVRSLVTLGGTVYAGGDLTSTGGQARTRLAAFSAAGGALQAWAPQADREVFAMVAPAGTGKMVVGGRFATLSGAAAYGLGAIDLANGATLPFPANQVVRNAGPDAAVWSLASDGTQVYGSGYAFGSGGNLENTFAANAVSGALVWVNGCRGDTYGVAPIGPVLYSTGHPHDCSMVGGLPQTQPETTQRAMASTTARGAGGAVNTSGVFAGRPAPELLHWLPTLAIGSVTGQYQAGWAIAATSEYVVLGGEFPRVNGVAQQGLVRFAVSGTAPNRSGPEGAAELVPRPASPSPGVVDVSWQSAWDRDDEYLTYQVLRGAGASAPVVATVTGGSNWWDRPRLSARDSSAPGGVQTYRVRASDPSGTTVTSASTTVTVVGPAQPPPPPVGGVLAADTFARTVTAGLGSAQTGGPWTTTGTASSFAVTDGAARMTLPAGRTVTARLDAVSATGTDVRNLLGTDQALTGGGVYFASTVRRTTAGEYRAWVRLLADGSVQTSVVRSSGGADTQLVPVQALAGVRHQPGARLAVRAQAVGTSPTTVRLKVWPAGAAEPAAWARVATDSTAGLQQAGAVGFWAYNSSSASTTGLRYDELRVTQP